MAVAYDKTPVLPPDAYLPYAMPGGSGGLPWVKPSAPSPTNPNPTTSATDTVASRAPSLAGRVSDVGGVLSGAAGGAASERERKMLALVEQNRLRQQQWQAEQTAKLQALLAGGRDKMEGYGTKQGATTNAMSGLQSATTNALGQQSAEGLQRSRLGIESGDARARQSVLASLMKNMQPTSVSGPAGQRGHETKISGGLSASALDPMTREHGSALLKQALEAQLTGSDVPAATDFKSGIQDWKSSVLDVPEATDYSKGLMPGPQYEDTYQKPGKLESILGTLGLIGKIGGSIFGR